MNLVERARRYLLRVPGSIAGQNGDNCLFMAAYYLVVGFGLMDETAIELLHEFNSRPPDHAGLGGCSPPWSMEKIVYKTEQAASYADQHPDQIGWLLNEDGLPRPRRRHRERTSGPRGRQSEPSRRPARMTGGRDAYTNHWEATQIALALARRPQIIKTPPAWQSGSPTPLPERPQDDWSAFLRLFAPDDVIWIGRRWDTGQPKHEFHFQSRADWEALPHSRARRVQRLRDVDLRILVPTDFGEFTCASAFKPGSYSRCDSNVLLRRFLVTEMDKFDGLVVPKSEQASCIEWLRRWLRLRCVLDAAGKSLHALWDFPDESTLAWLKLILPPLGFDPALFRPSQPCRLPGGERPDKKWKTQELLFIHLE